MAEQPRWVMVQKKTFTRWANTHLIDRNMPIQDLQYDLSDGVILINLMEIISDHTFSRYNKKPRIINQKLENLNFVLNFLKGQGLKLVGIGAEDIANGNLKLILGLIWTIILRYQIEKGRNDASRNALLEWVRSKIPEYDIRNFTTSWSSGLAICALGNAIAPGLVDMEGMTEDTPVENAHTGISNADEMLGIPAVFSAEDMVSAADDLSCMTYISYYRDYEEKNNSRLAAEEAERLARLAEITPDPAKTSASGSGLKTGEVNIPSEYVITTSNSKGKRIHVGTAEHGVPINAEVVDPEGNKLDNVVVHDNEDGTYTVTYTPLVAGEHKVTSLIDTTPIARQPVTVNVVPPQVDPEKSEVFGPGVEGCPGGVPAQFTIQAKNRIGDPITVGGYVFEVKITDAAGREIPCELKDNEDGTYTGEYVPVVGKDIVAVTYEKKKVADSPYTVEISADPNRAFAANCFAFGPGVEGGVNTFDPCEFTIQAVNPAGEKMTEGGDKFGVDIEDEEGNEVPEEAQITDNGDGTYGVVYKVAHPGKHIVTVKLYDDPCDECAYNQIKNSPYEVMVDAGLDCSKCIVSGNGVEEGVTDTDPADFVVEAVDANGNKMTEGGLPIVATLTDPDGNVTDIEMIDNGDGTYKGNYSCDKTGIHAVAISCKGVPIGKSPYEIEVEEGNDPENSGVGSFIFCIQAKNRRGEPMTRGGDRMVVKVSCAELEYEGDAEVTDNNDGTYQAVYEVPGPGKYKIDVTMNGRKIKGSPFTQEVP